MLPILPNVDEQLKMWKELVNWGNMLCYLCFLLWIFVLYYAYFALREQNEREKMKIWMEKKSCCMLHCSERKCSLLSGKKRRKEWLRKFLRRLEWSWKWFFYCVHRYSWIEIWFACVKWIFFDKSNRHIEHIKNCHFLI